MVFVENLCKFWRLTDYKLRIGLIKKLIYFPLFIIHEISHLLILWLFGRINKCKLELFTFVNSDTFVYYSCDIERITEEIDIIDCITAIMPNIVYLSMIILSIYFNNFILLGYLIIGYKESICSKEDLNIVYGAYKNIFKK